MGSASGATEGAVSEVSHRLLRRAVEAVTGESSSAGGAGALNHGPQHAVVAATGFFLVAKLLRSKIDFNRAGDERSLTKYLSVLTYMSYSVLSR